MRKLINIIKAKLFAGGYHIILIPENAQRTKRLHFSSLAARFFALSALLLIPLVAGSLFTALRYQSKFVALKQKQAEDRQIVEQKEILTTRLTGLERSVERVEQSLVKLENALDIEGGEMKNGLGPVEVPNEWEAKGMKAGLPRQDGALTALIAEEADDDLAIGKVRANANYLDQRIEGIKSKIETLYHIHEDRIHFLHAMPNMMPVDGWVTSDFGFRRSPYSGAYRMHDGIDIASPIGTAIRAPADGRVLLADFKGGYGRKIIIDHGYGVATVFAHASEFYVREGDTVKRGDIIAAVGSTGASTGPHLHYEVHVDGIPADPLQYITE